MEAVWCGSALADMKVSPQSEIGLETSEPAREVATEVTLPTIWSGLECVEIQNTAAGVLRMVQIHWSSRYRSGLRNTCCPFGRRVAPFKISTGSPERTEIRVSKPQCFRDADSKRFV